MCSLQIIPDKIVEIIVEKGIQALWRHLGYPLHYKQNLKNLEVENNKLQTVRRIVQEKIDDAETRGEVIESSVSDWEKEADGLTQGVETFMGEKAAKENIKCFKFSSPNFISRYKLSKEAKNKMDEVKSHAERANFDKRALDKISHPAPAPPELLLLSSGDYMNFGSREVVFDMIIKALEDPNVTMIGVYGTGGVGKTTLVKKVGDQVKKRLFDEVVIAVVSQKASIGNIQDQIADRLNLKWDERSEFQRAIQLWNRLNNGRKNLVILDDIWEKLDMKEIGIPITDGNKSCKVVLTSRNLRVLKDMEVCRDFPIDVLSEEEAWNLFKKKLGNDVDSRDPFHDIAHNVCRECNGLPVAILAVAAALKDKKLPSWRSSLDKLKKSMLNNIEDMDPKLYTSLKFSYDYLKYRDAKLCFLLCCLFPEDAQIPINELARHCIARRLFHDQNPESLEEARDIVSSVASTLKTSCLLLDGENDDFVKMHDVVRDVAILIAKEEKAFVVKHGVKEWPEMEADHEKLSALSLRLDTICKLPDELVYPKLHTLMLDCSKAAKVTDYYYFQEPSIKIPDKFFRWTEKLVVLELNSVIMLALPSSLEKLTELRMVCLNKCKLGDIRMLKCLKNKIEVLSLRGSEIEALPHEVGELIHLRLLDLGGCRWLKVIPNGVISKLVRLEELHFPRTFRNWEAATGNEQNSKVSLDELMSLPRLSTLDIHIPYLALLPIDVFSQNLIRFNIEVGAVSGLSDDDYSLQGVMLIKGFCSDDDLNFWERLLGKPKWFNNLTQLAIDNCGSLKYLFSPSSARELLQLQVLKIFGGEILESIIRNERETEEEIIENNVINFSQLKHLILWNLPCLISFYPRIKKATTGSPSLPPAQGLFNEKVALPVLEQIDIANVPKITAIWEMQTFSSPEKAANSSLSKLRNMRIWGCSNLVNVVKGFHNAGVRGTEKVKEKQVANYVLQLPQLRSLILRALERLSSFDDTSLVIQTRPLFNHQVALPALEEIYIANVPTITAIWEMQTFSSPEKAANSSLSKLRIMSIEGCSNLVNVVKGFHNTGVGGTEKIKEKQVANYILQLPQLRSLELEGLERLSSFDDTYLVTQTRPLFNHQVDLPALEQIYIANVPTITAIWEMQTFSSPEKAANSSLSKLMTMTIRHCSNLVNVVKGFHNTGVGGTEKIKEKQVANYILQLTQLRFLELKDLERLSSFDDTYLVTQTRPLFNHQPTFPALKELDVEDLPRITVIWGMQTFPIPENAAESSFSRLRINNTSLTTETRPLFNHQDPFPPLEKLSIFLMPNLTEIWNKNLPPTKLFDQLRSLIVSGCESLIYVFPSHILPPIRNIETLRVSNCLEMEVIIVLGEREEQMKEAANKDIIEFPKIRELALQQLEKLKGVCAYKSGDQLYFDVQVAFPKLRMRDSDDLDLDKHSKKIFKEAISGNKEMMDAFAKHYPEEENVLEDEVVSEAKDEETNKKDKAGPSQKRSKEAATRTPIPSKDDSQDDSMDEVEETPNKAGPSQKSLAKVAIQSLAPNEDDLEDEDDSKDEDEETPKKAGPSKRKPIESATKTSILCEDDKKDEDEQTPKKTKVGPARKG